MEWIKIKLLYLYIDLRQQHQVRTWNFPALVMYLTPLNGLYFCKKENNLMVMVIIYMALFQLKMPLIIYSDTSNWKNRGGIFATMLLYVLLYRTVMCEWELQTSP